MSGEPLRFDGRVAIVTGAGGQKPGLGESYARYLASRGARVVVNDLGIGPVGGDAIPASAQRVVDEINASGGEAIGDTHSVADPDSARAVVQAALDAWGRIDILVNNAGIVFFATFEEISETDVRRIVDSHLYGNIWMAKAAWPHMKKAGYGRIVSISSDAIYGFPYLTMYSAAKAGIVGLTHGLALEGARCGIKANALMPRAATRKHPYMMGLDKPAEVPVQLGTVDQVAPAVAYLCHERCDVSGKLFFAGGGTVREFRSYQTPGYTDASLTIEDVDHNLARILDQTGAVPVAPTEPSMMDQVPRRDYVPE
jgi:NAD(P)-dependent dehydrogenase (short-subunit alcohol dehydrogenase family)